MSVMAVTKATCGDPKVAKAMVDGGATSIADSRIENIKNLKGNGLGCELVLLRTPMLSEVRDVVKHTDMSLNSELPVIRKLSREAARQKEKHRIMLMVEMGDLREGINKDNLENTVKKILSYKGVELHGIGMNLACFAGVIPTEKKMTEFNKLVKELEKKFKIKFKIVSGGNSANIPLLFKKRKKSKVNNLRIGEGILLGLETVFRLPIPKTHQDAFTLETEIIELKKKASVPDGMVSQNAFGETPQFEDVGKINRGILGIGRQDVLVDGLFPLDEGVEILGASSDHIILHLKNNNHKVGSIVKFGLNYGALVRTFTSDYVHKKYVGA